jgi:hypothetical protein
MSEKAKEYMNYIPSNVIVTVTSQKDYSRFDLLVLGFLISKGCDKQEVEMYFKEIEDSLPISHGIIPKCFKALEKLGLISRRRNGKKGTLYKVNLDAKPTNTNDFEVACIGELDVATEVTEQPTVSEETNTNDFKVKTLLEVISKQEDEILLLKAKNDEYRNKIESLEFSISQLKDNEEFREKYHNAAVRLEQLKKENEELNNKLNEQEKKTNGIFEKIKYAFSSAN